MSGEFTQLSLSNTFFPLGILSLGVLVALALVLAEIFGGHVKRSKVNRKKTGKAAFERNMSLSKIQETKEII